MSTALSRLELGAAGTPAAPGTGVRPITDEEFGLFQTLIRAEAGINLTEPKRALLVGRLTRRLRELGLDDFGAYYRRVTIEDPAERVTMFDLVSTNETHFFREPKHFEFLTDRLFPKWKTDAAAGARTKRIRVWSAACSTGEEPYTLAMLLLDHFPPSSGWSVEILGTDISTRVLARASAAVWPNDRAAEIPTPYLKRFMMRGVGAQDGRIRAVPELRALVRFGRLNLHGATDAAGGPYDLVFCRNVLIYFTADDKHRVVDRLFRHLAPDGHLFLGHAESLSELPAGARRVQPSVYVRDGAAA